MITADNLTIALTAAGFEFEEVRKLEETIAGAPARRAAILHKYW